MTIAGRFPERAVPEQRRRDFLHFDRGFIDSAGRGTDRILLQIALGSDEGQDTHQRRHEGESQTHDRMEGRRQRKGKKTQHRQNITRRVFFETGVQWCRQSRHFVFYRVGGDAATKCTKKIDFVMIYSFQKAGNKNFCLLIWHVAILIKMPKLDRFNM